MSFKQEDRAGHEPPSLKFTKADHIKPSVSLISGAISGAVEASITYPFEFAKTRSQLGSTPGSQSRNPFALIHTTVGQGGVSSIYKGCSALILGTAFKAGIRFLIFDSIKGLLADSDGKLSASGGALAGMIAGVVESIVAVTPTERIKTDLIDDARSAKRFHGSVHALRAVINEQGLHGLYRGLLATTLKQSATSAVRMGSYNFLKEAVSRTSGAKNVQSPFVTFTVGALAGTITVYATQPFDSVKTRIQGAQGATTRQAILAIVKEGGIRAFWRGSSMRLGRLVLSGGIVFTTYENVVSFLKLL